MDRIEEAFRTIDRGNFVPAYLRGEAGVDAPLPIGYGQTISQPTTVRLMLSWLDAEPGNKVLDVGSGSGWTTALLANLVGSQGIVYAVERIPQLVEFGRENCHRIGVENAFFFESGRPYGLPEYGPYQRILVSASARELPTELLSQLAINGKLVIPVEDDILEITKTAEEQHETRVHHGFFFVPLV